MNYVSREDRYEGMEFRRFCDDADIRRAVAAGVRGRFHNAGQVCLAAKRFVNPQTVWVENA